MNHTHMAIGLVPKGLANVAVLLEFTPCGVDYTLTLIDERTGDSLTGSQFHSKLPSPFGYSPKEPTLDMAVYFGLANVEPLPAQLARGLAGFAFFQWHNPATISRGTRQKFGANL